MVEIAPVLKQQTTITITANLQQAIQLLQYSTLEMQEVIEQEILQNPLLEMRDEEDDRDVDRGEIEYEVRDIPDDELDYSERNIDDVDWDRFFQDSLSIGYPSYEGKDRKLFIENVVTKLPSLQEHLLWQLRLSEIDDSWFKVGEAIINNISDTGYLDVPLEEIIRESPNLSVSLEEAEEVLKLIQSFDPPGVGARSLAECLLAQVEGRKFEGVDVESMRRVIRDFLADLEGRRYDRIAEALGVTPEDVGRIAEAIKTLEPKPGRQFGEDEVKYVIPDIIVEKVEGDYVITLNDNWVPRLRINPIYSRMLKGNEFKSAKDREYVYNKLQSALTLLRGIEQRRHNIVTVSKCIFEVQRDFLERGVRYIKPLTLKDVARMAGLHESTVSRVTTNKYAQTPRGMYELKFFFSSAISSDSGSLSSLSVKRMIREMIENEDGLKPLSDASIVRRFREDGIDIARRTVAKYREEMGIPASSKRKRMR
ncbi:MAG: RNA polymerase factor sigma-54 [bacterium]